MPEKLDFEEIPHAYWSRGIRHVTETEPLGLGNVRYYRFMRDVQIDSIRIFPEDYRNADVHLDVWPSHIEISCYNTDLGRWEMIREEFPDNEGSRPYNIGMNGIRTDHIRISCDRKHPLPLIHGHLWRNPEIVNFSLLDHVEFWGVNLQPEKDEPVYHPPLRKTRISPKATEGQQVVAEPQEISFRSPYFAVTFSLRRPMILHLGWDDIGSGLSRDNFIHAKPILRSRMFSGPVLRNLRQDVNAMNWTGEVEVDGNKVIYRNLRATEDYTMDVEFEVHEKGMHIGISKQCFKDYISIESDDWRFIWDATHCITGTMGLPSGDNERTGIVPFPALWNAPGHGTVLLRKTDGNKEADLQVESWRDKWVAWAGITLGAQRDEFGSMFFKKGTYQTRISIEVQPTLPKFKGDAEAAAVPEGILRAWSAVYAFRPEYGGFSNNSISVNCHLSQYHVAEMAIHTAQPDGIPKVTDLLRYTLELALKGGPGMGVDHENWKDADPSLLIALGRIYQAEPDREWFRRMWFFIHTVCERVIGSTDESGLIVSNLVTGNSGTGKYSTNAWDCISFGHYDALSNVQAYRALKNIAAVAKGMDDSGLFRKCTNTAAKLKERFYSCFYNPETGWLGGWRSEDGQLHDYAFTFINYMAVCYGLVEGENARSIIQKLEDKMAEMEMDYFYYGIPCSLLPIRNEDASDSQKFKRQDGWDEFGIYINGCLTTHWNNYYIRALSMYGYQEKADLVCNHLERSFSENRTTGGLITGLEFRTWEGRACGYEGVLIGCYPVLSAIAQHRGLLDVPEPEWWPE